MRLVQFVGFGLVLLICAFPAHAANYYVDNVAGSDTTGDGSQGSPYATIQKAENESSSGVADNFYLKYTGSTYDSFVIWKSGAGVGSPDIFQPWPGDDSPTISSLGMSKSGADQPTYVTMKNLKFYPGAWTGTTPIGCSGGSYQGQYFTLDGCDVRSGYDAEAIHLWGASGATPNFDGLTIKDSVVHSRGGYSSTTRVIHIESADGTMSLNNATIQDSTVYYEGPNEGTSGQHLIEISVDSADNLLIDDNWLNAAFSVSGHEGRDVLRTTVGANSQISNNRIYDARFNGMWLNVAADATNVLIRNNLITNTAQAGSPYAACFISAGANSEVDFLFNTCADGVEGLAVWENSDASASIEAKYNIFADNLAHGIQFYGSAPTGVLTESYDCFYNNAGGNISDSRSLGTGAVTEDPDLDSQYNLAPTSPCVDAADDTADNLGLGLPGDYAFSTQADNSPDTANADLGFHHEVFVYTPSSDASDWESYY